MKTRTIFSWMVFVTVLGMMAVVLPAVMAQTLPAPEVAVPSVAAAPPIVAAPPAADMTTAVTAFVIGVVPMLIWALKKFMPLSVAPYFPLVAVALGPVVAWASGYATTHSVSPTTGLILGGAAVGLREIVDQLKQVTLGESK